MTLITILIMKDSVLMVDSGVFLTPGLPVASYKFQFPSTPTKFKEEDQETETGALLNNLLQYLLKELPIAGTFFALITPQSKSTVYGLRKQQYHS